MTQDTAALERLMTFRLEDGKEVRRDKRYHSDDHCWSLRTQDGHLIRGLNMFEQGFIDSAIKAAVAQLEAQGEQVAPIKTWQERCDWLSNRPAPALMVESMKAEIADLRAALASAAPQPPATQAAAVQPMKPTDLSMRLRKLASGHFNGAIATAKLANDAADEIERYYGAMLAWKQTAEKKDADWQAERMGRVNDRIAARTAAVGQLSGATKYCFNIPHMSQPIPLDTRVAGKITMQQPDDGGKGGGNG